MAEQTGRNGRSSRGGAGVGFLVSLALLSTISPFSTDMYLPAFPQITAEFRTAPSTVQLTLTTFLLGIAAGQLTFGPLSDRLGRKPPLLVGTTLCVLASLTAALAPSVGILLVARFAQGLGGAAGIVISRAIVADIFHGSEAARTYSMLAAMGGLAPIVAPLLGGSLATPVGWRGVMGILLALTVGMLVVALFVIPETNPRALDPALRVAPTQATARLPGSVSSAVALLRRPGFTGHALTRMFGFGVMMSYISASPFVFQNLIGVGPLGSGLLFAANSVALIIANNINVRLVRRFGPRRMLRSGLSLLTGAVALLAVLAFAHAPAWWLPVPLILLVGSMGLILGNSIALAMSCAREAAGTGSAFIGSGSSSAVPRSHRSSAWRGSRPRCRWPA